MYSSTTMVGSAPEGGCSATSFRRWSPSWTRWVSLLAAPCRGLSTTGKEISATSASIASGVGSAGTTTHTGTGRPPSRKARRCMTLSSSFPATTWSW